MLLLYVLLCLAPAITNAAKIKPASYYFDICKTSNPKYAECVKKTIIKSAPNILTGIPELRVPGVDNVVIPKLAATRNSGNFKLNGQMTDALVTGIKNFTLQDLKITNGKKISVSYKVFNPKILMVGDYEIDGQVLVIPLKGNGKAIFNLTNVVSKGQFQFDEFTKNGKVHYKITNFTLDFEPEHISFNFSNLLGDKALGDAVNTAINDNWREFFSLFKDVSETAFAEVYKSIGNTVLAAYPNTELFPK